MGIISANNIGTPNQYPYRSKRLWYLWGMHQNFNEDLIREKFNDDLVRAVTKLYPAPIPELIEAGDWVIFDELAIEAPERMVREGYPRLRFRLAVNKTDWLAYITDSIKAGITEIGQPAIREQSPYVFLSLDLSEQTSTITVWGEAAADLGIEPETIGFDAFSWPSGPMELRRWHLLQRDVLDGIIANGSE